VPDVVEADDLQGSFVATPAAGPDELIRPDVLTCFAHPDSADPERWAAARAWLGSLPIAALQDALRSPLVQDQLARLVPLLRVSRVIPCLHGPGMAELVVPWLDPSQCRLLGPEVATLIAPALELNWDQLGRIPIETVVLVPTDAFSTLPVQVMKQLPDAHRHYVAPYVRRARKVNHDHHELALALGLCETLHLYTCKVLDPEHIPDAEFLRTLQRDDALCEKLVELRWLVDAVMTPSVEAVQLDALKLTTLAALLRKSRLGGLANELETALKERRGSRGPVYGAGRVAYTQHQAIAARHRSIDDAPLPEALPEALRDACTRLAGLGGRGVYPPLPIPSCTSVICVELAAADPPRSPAEWHELEAAIREQLGEPCNGVAIQEVQLRWADATATLVRRQPDGSYRR
jgi:hypothetical protein